MSERSEMMTWLRGELVGPSQPLTAAAVAVFAGTDFTDALPQRRGPLVWKPTPEADAEEVLYFDRESPHRKYGTGLLHPTPVPLGPTAPTPAAEQPDQAALQASDTVGAETEPDEGSDSGAASDSGAGVDVDGPEAGEDFEVTSPDIRYPSTIGISFCVRMEKAGSLVVKLPQQRLLSWQPADAVPFRMNGRYEQCKRHTKTEHGLPLEAPVWRRVPAVPPDTQVEFKAADLLHGKSVRKDVTVAPGSPLQLRVEVFARYREESGVWLLTVVLRNSTQISGSREPRESVLYQTYFEVTAENGSIERYPESQRPFKQLDAEEQSLALLYRESATWGVGHGCSAGWDAEPGAVPTYLYADVMPAVELPSMTPDIQDADGNRIQLSMRALSTLPDDGSGPAWQSLENLAKQYEGWIAARQKEAATLGVNFSPVAVRHLEACSRCLTRINEGIALLKKDERARCAFRLSNLAMLLQQIGTKQLKRRPLQWNETRRLVAPEGATQSPWDVYHKHEEANFVGSWRAFQIAFLLMSLDGIRDGLSEDREIVDLIWFPTGGGKTEAYLGAMAFYMFHQRLLITEGDTAPARDGTNVLMRYTLRMLTTQQFQRAASLVCAMEFLRRNPGLHGMGAIAGQRFSLGLWIGGEGSPNKIEGARIELNEFRRGDVPGNPLILTECPWCRAEIGQFDGKRPKGFSNHAWNVARTRGITDIDAEGPLLHCTDGKCSFGPESHANWLPIEVIDERIYRHPPSLVIGTADKLAMVAYRPDAGALFGRRFVSGQPRQISLPPGLIIQDELHLISGPLGTMYALYEGVFERLCSYRVGEKWVKPKLIASTATIRGAADQVKSLYARSKTSLFPSPGLMMGDSFFGRYARGLDGKLSPGRLYLGIHASNYGSTQTTQVRTFATALFRPYSFAPERRDPWWTLLAFYNSIRELGGAQTLFMSDIRSRLKFMFNREDFGHDKRRHMRIVEELTSRLSQAEIVAMMDRLSAAYDPGEGSETLDACLASNIIEVGVDIDRLSLMAVTGQPKTTATYIQVTGRVGRRWSERPGLILMVYSPAKSRDRSHFEQFHSYHRRLYERVEPTSATPFALSAIQRALPGALLTWARQQSNATVQNKSAYDKPVAEAYDLLRERCKAVQTEVDQQRSLEEMGRVMKELSDKWGLNPQTWEEFPPAVNGEYLMLWPGQFATLPQKQRGVVVPTSMRQVDRSAELTINQGYVPTTAGVAPAAPPATSEV